MERVLRVKRKRTDSAIESIVVLSPTGPTVTSLLENLSLGCDAAEDGPPRKRAHTATRQVFRLAHSSTCKTMPDPRHHAADRRPVKDATTAPHQEAATKRSAQASQARRKLHVKAVTQARSARGVCVLDVEGREAPGPRTCPVCPPSAPAARAATERKLPRRRRGNAPPGAARPGAPQAPADDPPPDVAVFLQMLEAAEADPPVEYVYDYYYIDEEMTAEAEDSEDMAVVEIGDEFQMLLEEAPELMVPKLPAWEEDVDSNASDNPNNDYPDTESESEYIEQEVGYGLGSGYYAEPDYDAAWGDDEGAYESYRPEAARAPHDGFAEYLLRQAEVGGTRTLHRGHEAMVRDYVSAMET